MDTNIAVTARQPWNKGKLVGQKAHSNSRRYGRSEFASKSPSVAESWRSSI
jgi:hypothetical protein